MIDLHMHTVYSDGTCQPEELVEAALEQGLQAIAITDHDNTLSLEIARRIAAQKSEETGKTLEIIPGIEINTVWNNREVHILGYYIDPDNEMLKDVIAKHCQARVVQIREIAERLQQAGLSLTFDDIASFASTEGAIGRPHIAKAIVACGGTSTISEAFSKYISRDCSTYVRRDTVSPHEAVEAIYESGGIAVIAHPKDMEDIEELVTDLMNYGLRGLEAYHRSHSPALIEFHCSLAEQYGLIVTGGTDFHGPQEKYAKALSNVHMPDFVYKMLKTEADNLKQSAFKAS